MPDMAETGAIDYLLIEAPGKKIDGALVPPLLDLVDRRLIRILDALIIVKRGDGDFDVLTTSDLDPATGRRRGRPRRRFVGHVGRGRRRGGRRGPAGRTASACSSSTRTCGPSSSGSRPERRAPSSWPTATSRPRPSWPRSTPSKPDRKGNTMGLIGGMARTAVVVGTATAVRGRVSRRQQTRWAQEDQAAYAAQPQAAPPPQYAQPAPQYARRHRSTPAAAAGRSGRRRVRAVAEARRAQGCRHPHRRGVHHEEGPAPGPVGRSCAPIVVTRLGPRRDDTPGAVLCTGCGGRYWTRTSDFLGVSEAL